jgi:hypothetical protein
MPQLLPIFQGAQPPSTITPFYAFQPLPGRIWSGRSRRMLSRLSARLRSSSRSSTSRRSPSTSAQGWRIGARATSDEPGGSSSGSPNLRTTVLITAGQRASRHLHRPRWISESRQLNFFARPAHCCRVLICANLVSNAAQSMRSSERFRSSCSPATRDRSSVLKTSSVTLRRAPITATAYARHDEWLTSACVPVP